MPFALNDATRHISPTKAPEYVAGGVPVVSTPVPDVVASYAGLGGVSVAAAGAPFLAACEEAARLPRRGAWLTQIDEFLQSLSWDATFQAMRSELDAVLAARPTPLCVPPQSHRPASRYDVLVVGAGFAGSVMAERLASHGHRVLVVDRREHIGGNAHDRMNAAGILVHPYGPTSSTPRTPRSSTICRASPSGDPTSTGCWRRSGASTCRCRSTAPCSTSPTASPSTATPRPRPSWRPGPSGASSAPPRMP